LEDVEENVDDDGVRCEDGTMGAKPEECSLISESTRRRAVDLNMTGMK
jgi:hypothetical protein